MKFSSGHFAIFSSELRENLHGHNYNVCASFTTIIEDEGFSFDYRFYKNKVRKICDSLNEITLLPEKCKHLRFEDGGDYTHVYFSNEKLIFLKRDIKILPVYNITVEELSNWVLNQILLDKTELAQNKIVAIKVKVFSGPGQSGSAEWRSDHG
jgi:6-pyruvoyltetrahydropterin/6-carboxytetrahydropterin synthase